MIRIVIADDHEIVRSGFAMILETQPDMIVIGDAADGSEAYNLVARLKPDILLLDISMPPGESGLMACEKIARDFPTTRTVILTMFEETDYLFYTLRGGASGYMLKNASTAELLKAVRTVAAGEIYVQPKMAERLTEKLLDRPETQDRDPYQLLSNRELEVLTLLAQGYTNKEIAERIFLSVKTVETHRAKIYAKLGIESRAELVHLAIRYHLLSV